MLRRYGKGKGSHTVGFRVEVRWYDYEVMRVVKWLRGRVL